MHVVVVLRNAKALSRDGTWSDKTENYQNAEEYKSRHSHSCHFKMIISLTSSEGIRLCPCLLSDQIAETLLQI